MSEQAIFVGVSRTGVSISSKADDRYGGLGRGNVDSQGRARKGGADIYERMPGEITHERSERRLTVRCSEKPDTPPIAASA